jgi:hypothetical protein
MTEVPSGFYRLRFQLGQTLMAEHRKFCNVHSTSEFDGDLDFNWTATDDGWEYSSFEVTLHAVPDGNASTSTIPPGGFELPAPMDLQTIDTLSSERSRTRTK